MLGRGGIDRVRKVTLHHVIVTNFVDEDYSTPKKQISWRTRDCLYIQNVLCATRTPIFSVVNVFNDVKDCMFVFAASLKQLLPRCSSVSSKRIISIGKSVFPRPFGHRILRD